MIAGEDEDQGALDDVCGGDLFEELFKGGLPLEALCEFRLWDGVC